MVELMRRARLVVTHAGVGSIMTALIASKRPVVVPRLRSHGEAVDDHQVAFGRRAEESGLVVLVEDEELLREVVCADAGVVATELRPDRRLVAELREYLAEAISNGR
jgi:UDP-N-acetylglucosamine transferase subunit ALG13